MEKSLDFTLKRSRLFEQVADKIQSQIVNESLHPGDKLPSERDLAESLGVSRTVIREAVRVLSVRGLLTVKAGSGTYIQEVSADDASSSVGFFLKMRHGPLRYHNLNEVRRTLEIEIAGLAAERANDEDVQALEEAVEKIPKCAEDAELFTHCDLEFHSVLATSTQNELYNILMTPITELLLEFRLTAYRMNKEGAVDGAMTYHREILDCVKARDPEGARRAMRLHLDQAEKLIEAAYSQAKD